MTRLVLFALAAATPAVASPPNPVSQAISHVQEVSPPPAGVELSVDRVTHWDAGSFVRLGQRAWDLPVEQATLKVQLDNALAPKRIIGTHLKAPGPRPDVQIPAQAAIEKAEHATTTLFGTGASWWPARAELGAWADVDGQVHLVWNVDTSRAAPAGMYRTRVDVVTGEVLSFSPTMHHASGDIYPTNPDTSELTTVELLRLDEGNTLDGEHTSVFSCTSFSGQQCSATARFAEADGAGDYFYDPDAGATVDPFAEVQMYYHVDKVGQFFSDEYGFSHPQPIEALVNFEYQNAFFGDADGDGVGEIAFGQNAAYDFAYDGDVVYHEFVHSVFAQVAAAGFFEADEYGIDFSPMALNEGTADLFSMVITEDPQLGEYAGKGFGLNGPVRDLEADRRCPHNLYGQQHTDGQIWASMGWNLIEDERVGPQVAGQLTYGFLELLPRQISWVVAGETVTQAADDLLESGAIDQATRDAISEHVQAAGLVACERVIPLDDGFEPTLFAAYINLGTGDPVPVTAQFKIEVPENAEQVSFQVTRWQSNDPNMKWSIYARRGEFIRHDVRNVGGFIDLPVPADFDHQFDQDDIGTDGTIILSLNSDPALVPGATYYFSMAATSTGGGFGLSSGEAQVQASVTLGDPIDTDTDDDLLEEQPAGCACDSSSPAGLAWLLAAPLGLALLRRRRR